MRVWVMSQFYMCPEFDFIWPVCSAYGEGCNCPWHTLDAVESGQWGLIRMSTTGEHIEAMKDDPRVLYVGDDWAPVHPKVIEIFGQWLDPTANYLFMGQVISKLAQWSPTFAGVDDNYSK